MRNANLGWGAGPHERSGYPNAHNRALLRSVGGCGRQQSECKLSMRVECTDDEVGSLALGSHAIPLVVHLCHRCAFAARRGRVHIVADAEELETLPLRTHTSQLST